MYALRVEGGEPPAQQPASRDYDLWRVWASPGAPLALAVNRVTGETHAVAHQQSVGNGEVKLLPADLDRHRSIATEFLGTHDRLPEAVALPLRQALDDPKLAWWRWWMEVLRDFPDIYQVWNEYRRRALESALHGALADAGLESMAVDRALREVTTRDNLTRRSGVTPAPQASRRIGTGAASRNELGRASASGCRADG